MIRLLGRDTTPKTQTKPKRYRPDDGKKIALEIEDPSAVIELNIESRTVAHLNQNAVILFIRPYVGEKESDILKGKEKRYYRFMGISPHQLREMVERSLSSTRSIDAKIIGQDNFEYIFSKVTKDVVYTSVEGLHRTYLEH